MAAIGTATRSRRAGRPAHEDGSGGKGASKAEHFHQYEVPVECEADVRCRLYAAQDRDGKWFASDGLQVGGERCRSSVLTPFTAPKFESEAAALRAAAGELERWLALEAGADRDVMTAIGQAVHEWMELVHKHIAGRELAEVMAKRDASRAEAAEPLGQAQGRREMAQGRIRQIVEVPLDKIHRHPGNRVIKESTCRELAKDLQARGLLQPIQIRDPGTLWQLPEGHYQIVFGERRAIAARLAGWDTIPAEIVTLDDRATQEAIAAENGHRAQLNDVERARRLAEMTKPEEQGGGGLTQTAAAAAMGIDQSTASTLVKLLTLPKPWQDLVIAGAMPGSHLRPLLPYADCPRVMRLLLDVYQETQHSDCEEDRAVWSTRATIEKLVPELLSDRTRPLTQDDLFPGDGNWCKPRFALPASTSGLDVVEVPGEDGPVKRCFNVRVWQDLQVAALRGGQGNGSQGRQGKQGSSGSAKAKPAAPTAAELRKKEADEDRELRERIRRPGGLAEQGLRFAMGAAIGTILRGRPGGTEATAAAGQVLLDAARESAGSSDLNYTAWRYLAWRLVRADRVAKGQSPGQIVGLKNHEAYAGYTGATLAAGNDYISEILAAVGYLARLILYPSDERIQDTGRLAKWGEWPERWPWVEQRILADLAAGLGAKLTDTWEAAQRAGPARRWLELLIAAHSTRRQRLGLAEELGVACGSGDKLDEIGRAIVTEHGGRLLRLPAVLKDFGGVKKRGGSRQRAKAAHV